MKLMTKAIEKALPALYATDGTEVKKVIVKFFTPDAQCTWLVFEGEKMNDGDFQFFGAVDIGHGQGYDMGYFQLSELAQVRGHFNLPIERDRNFTGSVTIKDRQVVDAVTN